MEKLIFEKQFKSSKSSLVVRISTDLYDKLVEISDKTNTPISNVANKCIDFAIKNHEIK